MAKRMIKKTEEKTTKVVISANPGNIWATVERAMLTTVNALRKLPPNAEGAGPEVLSQALHLKDVAADQFLMNI